MWDVRHLELAMEISTWSKDPSSQVGAVIIDSNRHPISWGYNGFPRGIKDDSKRLDNRVEKYPRVIHAEANSILLATRSDLTDCTLYCTHAPCSRCAGLIIQKRIRRVVYYRQQRYESKWATDLMIAGDMFREVKIPFMIYNLKAQCVFSRGRQG